MANKMNGNIKFKHYPKEMKRNFDVYAKFWDDYKKDKKRSAESILSEI